MQHEEHCHVPQRGSGLRASLRRELALRETRLLLLVLMLLLVSAVAAAITTAAVVVAVAAVVATAVVGASEAVWSQ
jgi:uncharacterized membrane-anchored protein